MPGCQLRTRDRTHRLLFGGLAALLLGCASNPHSPISDARIEGKPVYVRLMQSNGTWRIDGVLHDNGAAPSAESIDVSLNDLEPYLTESGPVTIICIPLWGCHVPSGEFYKDKDQILNSIVVPATGPFVTSDLDVGKTALMNSLGLVFTLGMAAGTTERQFKFDKDAYEKALAAAMVDAKLTTDKRSRAVNDYWTAADKVERANQDLKEALSQAKDAISAGHPDIEVRMQNLSGFPDALVADAGVRVNTTAVIPDFPSAPNLAAELKPLLADFGAGLPRLESVVGEKIADFKRNVAVIQGRPPAYYLDCTSGKLWNVAVNCPAKLDTSGGKATVVDVTVKSRKTLPLGLPDLEKNDGSVLARLTAEGVWLENETASYVTVEALSLYLGKKISTTSVTIELPPHGAMVQPYSLANFDSALLQRERPMQLYNVTGQDVDSITTTVGLGVKYVIVDKNMTRTLYATRFVTGADMLNAPPPKGW